jgi:hypothetical protein
MLTVAHYIQFLGPDGTPLAPAGVRSYQNYFIGQARTFGSVEYQFAPFSISGDVSTEGAENGEAELLAPANFLSGAVFWEAASQQFLLQVQTVLLIGTPPETVDGYPIWSEAGALSCDLYICDAMTYTDAVPGELDATAVFALKLTNPLNFVTGNSPTRRLRDDQVGALPSSGGITF